MGALRLQIHTARQLSRVERLMALEQKRGTPDFHVRALEDLQQVYGNKVYAPQAIRRKVLLFSAEKCAQFEDFDRAKYFLSKLRDELDTAERNSPSNYEELRSAFSDCALHDIKLQKVRVGTALACVEQKESKAAVKILKKKTPLETLSVLNFIKNACKIFTSPVIASLGLTAFGAVGAILNLEAGDPISFGAWYFMAFGIAIPLVAPILQTAGQALFSAFFFEATARATVDGVKSAFLRKAAMDNSKREAAEARNIHCGPVIDLGPIPIAAVKKDEKPARPAAQEKSGQIGSVPVGGGPPIPFRFDESDSTGKNSARTELADPLAGNKGSLFKK
ncbi:Uncharacterised protein [Candidatus Gugararchaeum adminiculabundum]|nr:Uncharacterised protein [Candidatus Gugararchaeum adminiculabundum]